MTVGQLMRDAGPYEIREWMAYFALEAEADQMAQHLSPTKVAEAAQQQRKRVSKRG